MNMNPLTYLEGYKTYIGAALVFVGAAMLLCRVDLETSLGVIGAGLGFMGVGIRHSNSKLQAYLDALFPHNAQLAREWAEAVKPYTPACWPFVLAALALGMLGSAVVACDPVNCRACSGHCEPNCECRPYHTAFS